MVKQKTRREILTSVGGLVAGIALARPAFGARACHGRRGHGAVCVTGFAEPPMMPAATCRSDSWAISLAYVLRGYGADVTADSVKARFDALDTCSGEDGDYRLSDIQGHWMDERKREFLVESTLLPSLDGRVRGPDIDLAVKRLTRQPMICGAAGHATVITEIATSENWAQGMVVDRIRVRDPWNGGALRDLTDAELKKPFYVLSVAARALAFS